jgi:integrase/recombinase XerD
MMAAERGASAHTLDAYRRDLLDFSAYSDRQKRDLPAVDRAFIEQFMVHLSKSGIAARSVARKLSALRQFFEFLYGEKIRSDNPAATIAAPRTGRSLPDTLGVRQVAALLEAARADMSPKGVRLQAMMELIYGAGLRVSELVGLKLSALQVKEGGQLVNTDFLIIHGKGNKERLVPLHGKARAALSQYLGVREQFLPRDKAKPDARPKPSPYVFPYHRAEGFVTRQQFGVMLRN